VDDNRRVRSVLLVAAALSALALGGCTFCGFGACAKEQGRAVTAIVPRPDGSIVVTTCTLTTKGTSATVTGCRDHVIPPP
jgi:hypothetical protein